jgi:hypothetical protein
MSFTKLSLTGIININPAGECLVSDIPAGDGKIVHLFLQRGNHFEADVSKSEW